MKKFVFTPESLEMQRKDKILPIWKNNFFENQSRGNFKLPRVRPLNYLLNTMPYSKKPVVLVAAGPSLDKNLHILKEYQDKCIIICAEVILFKLYEAGITPDFVVTIDPSETFVRFLTGVDTLNPYYVCPTTVHPSVVDIWQGNIFFFCQTDIPGSIKADVLKDLEIANWTTIQNNYFVGATMLQLAAFMNPQSIALVGYDFAFSDGKAYCDGFLERKIYDDTNPHGSEAWANKINELKKAEVSHEYFEVVNGQKVYTTFLYREYKRVFLELCIKYQIPFCNCTEGGILTEVSRAPLESYCKEVCKDSIKKYRNFTLPARKKKKK